MDNLILNPLILDPKVQKYINQHLSSDLTKLILKGSPFKNIDTLEIIEQIEAKKKCQTKLPTWFSSENIYYPNKLNIEQTSSEETAHLKSSFIKGDSIIDITGGFGVDSYFFSKHFKKVTHCEINAELSQKAKHNYKVFNKNNITCVHGDGIEHILKHSQKYDWIYTDPSRRHQQKGKVFLLKDCLPNIPKHLNQLFDKTKQILIKNSPLIDLKSCINELKFVKTIYVVALKNDVKEVLIQLEKNYTGPIHIQTYNIDRKLQTFDFIFEQNYSYTITEPQNYLYEPNSAILKSGGFTAVSEKFNLNKLHQNSHLYTSDFFI